MTAFCRGSRGCFFFSSLYGLTVACPVQTETKSLISHTSQHLIIITQRPNKESLRTLSMVLRQLPPTNTTSSSSSPNQQQQQLQQEEEDGDGVGTDGSKGGQETTKGAGKEDRSSGLVLVCVVEYTFLHRLTYDSSAGAVGGRKRPLTLVQESVQRAKEAVMLDLTDPKSWCECFALLCFAWLQSRGGVCDEPAFFSRMCMHVLHRSTD